MSSFWRMPCSSSQRCAVVAAAAAARVPLPLVSSSSSSTSCRQHHQQSAGLSSLLPNPHCDWQQTPWTSSSSSSLLLSTTRCAAGAPRGASSSSTSGSTDPQQQQQQQQQLSPQRARLAQLLGLKLPGYCSGCGVKLQQADPDGPGYFQIPRRLLDMAEEQAEVLQGGSSSTAAAAGQQQQLSPEERERRALDAAMEAWLDEQQRPAIPSLGGDTTAAAAAAAMTDEVLTMEGDSQGARQPAITCARCYSLVHYGKVRSAAAEAALPAFDLGRKVGRKIALQRDRRATVLCVVDVADFDGSLPRAALTSLFPSSFPAGGGGAAAPLPQDPDELPFTLAVAVNKFDLLPTQATPQRVQQWVRARLRQAGLPRPSRVFMVSALNGLGVAAMCRTLQEDMGFRADLWVVGAQNAGKSSLISAMRRLGGSSSSSSGGRGAAAAGDPTVAPIPGTTLGLLRVPGVPLGPKHRTFDTPGVPHSYQLTSRLTLSELPAVLPRRRLKPRTYVLPLGSSVLLGGLARIDAVSGPSANLYVTVFVSDEVVTHMGKTEGAEERRQRHVGGRLTPPFEPARLAALGPLLPRTAVVEGDSWRQHSRDIAIAGLGWISVGVSGSAELQVWVPEGVMVTLHDALVPDYAREFQKPGFSKLLPGQGTGAGIGDGGGAAAPAAPGAGKKKKAGRRARVQTKDSLSDADDDEEEQ